MIQKFIKISKTKCFHFGNNLSIFTHQLATKHMVFTYLLPALNFLLQPLYPSSTSLINRIDLPHKLYELYKKESFKFSQQGITPRVIAEQLAIYTHDSEHLKIEIDSFGNILTGIKEAYFEEMRKSMKRKGKIGHYPIRIKNLEWQEQKDRDRGFLYETKDLSLSSLRIIYYLELLCKKRVLLGEYHPSKLVKYIDCSLLSSKEIELFQSLSLIDLQEGKFEHSFPEDDYYEGIHRQSNLIYGCLRHESNSFQSQRSFLKKKPFLFGEVFPRITLSTLSELYPESYKQELVKLLKYSLKFDSLLPIDLNSDEPCFNLYPFQTLKKYSENQVLIILLDYLGSDELIPALRHFQALKSSNLIQDSQLLTLFQDFQSKMFE